MVLSPLSFGEVASEIQQFTEGKVFVAHNVRFDYSFKKRIWLIWALIYQQNLVRLPLALYQACLPV